MAPAAGQANLAAIGVKVKIQQMDNPSWVKRFFDNGNSEMSFAGGDGGSAVGGYGFIALHSSSKWPQSGNGWKGYVYSNPDLDKLLEEVRTAFDPAARTPLLQQICKIDAEEQPFVNLWATTRYWFIDNRIGNFVSTPGPAGGNYYQAAETWYVK